MSAHDPTRTVHFAIANRLELFMCKYDGYSSGVPLADCVREGSDLGDRDHYVTTVTVAWFALAFGCLAGAFFVGYPVQLLVGDGAGRSVALAFLTGGSFCLGGCVNGLWRKYWHVPRARRLRSFGDDSEQYRAAMRRTLPRNTSLIGQAAISAFALVVTL